MKSLMVFFTLIFGIAAHADIPVELKCRNKNYESLEWHFTTTKLSAKGKPGQIQGAITSLQFLYPGSEGHAEYAPDLNSPTASIKRVANYMLISISLPDSSGVDKFELKLYNEMGFAIEDADPSHRGELFVDVAEVEFRKTNGTVFIRRDFGCAVVLR